MNSSQYKLEQFQYFCSLVYSTPEQINYITENIDSYYNEWFEKKPNKETGGFKCYKDGTLKKRVIRPSLYKLKKIQTAIKLNILDKIPLPTNIQGGVKGKSNITNAKLHQGNKFQFSTDLQNFFPSIKYKQVHNTILKQGFSKYFAYWITKLTTWKYELPQGTPTSTILANLVFLDIDYKLIELCNQHSIKYTRFVDDLFFSSQKDIQPIINEIISIVLSSGFKINYRKTFYKGNQILTGIQLHNNFIDAPKKIKEKVKEEALNNSTNKPLTIYNKRIRSTNKNIKPKKTNEEKKVL